MSREVQFVNYMTYAGQRWITLQDHYDLQIEFENKLKADMRQEVEKRVDDSWEKNR